MLPVRKLCVRTRKSWGCQRRQNWLGDRCARECTPGHATRDLPHLGTRSSFCGRLLVAAGLSLRVQLGQLIADTKQNTRWASHTGHVTCRTLAFQNSFKLFWREKDRWQRCMPPIPRSSAAAALIFESYVREHPLATKNQLEVFYKTGCFVEYRLLI